MDICLVFKLLIEVFAAMLVETFFPGQFHYPACSPTPADYPSSRMQEVSHVSWHHKGDYFSTTSPDDILPQ
jgi:hypothetical protein